MLTTSAFAETAAQGSTVIEADPAGLAAAEVQRRRSDWREVAAAFVNRAGEATDNCWAAVV